MKEYIKQIIDILKANGLTGIKIDLISNTVWEQQSLDDVEQDNFDINQAISDIRKDNPEVQQEDAIVESGIPEGYYSLDQVEALTGLRRTSVSDRMRSIRVRVLKLSRLRHVYNKEDVDKYVAIKNQVASYTATLDIAKSLNVSGATLNQVIKTHNIKTVYCGHRMYVSKEEEAKIRELYRYANGSDVYISTAEIRKILGCSRSAADKFADLNNIPTVGRYIVNDRRTRMYNRADVLVAIERRKQAASIGKYEITTNQLADLLQISYITVNNYSRKLGLHPSRKVANKVGALILNAYDIRYLVEEFKRNGWTYQYKVLQRELERRESL